MERLQKIIASRGVCSRRRAEELIAAGQVTVNSEIAVLGQTADPEQDEILVEGKPLPVPGKRLYLMLNKPRGYVTTLSDEKGRKNAAELVSGCGSRVYPVGRLDMDSEGLLLLTNDGDFAHRILAPGSHIEKHYEVLIDGRLTAEEEEYIRKGTVLADGYACMPCELTLLRDEAWPTYEIVLHEGKYHQIKRMFGTVQKGVVELKRTKMGGLILDENLKEGECRKIVHKELDLILCKSYD